MRLHWGNPKGLESPSQEPGTEASQSLSYAAIANDATIQNLEVGLRLLKQDQS